MFEIIEKLLILQDRDRKIRRLQGELAHIEPEQNMLRQKGAAAQTHLEQARNHVKQLESNRKALELEVEEKKQLIIKYANQQFQTRKNEEYQALSHEIQMCKEAIAEIEDREIAIMEEMELAQKEVIRATQAAQETARVANEQVSQLQARGENLRKEVQELTANREELAAAVEEGARNRYERLSRSKGENVVVGVQHGVCGGCHMRLPPQLIVACQARKELVTCSNCGRIVYYLAGMDLAVAE